MSIRCQSELGLTIVDDRAARIVRIKWCVLAFALTSILSLFGCGYSFRPPYDSHIRTVYVPIMRAFTFRRDLNLQLTEAVVKQIQTRTPFRVVNSPEKADATLEGIFETADKNLGVENPNNLPRQLTTLITVNAKFYDNSLPQDKRDIAMTTFTASVPFYPEIGETTSLAFQKTIDKMASQIVGTMEKAW